VAVTLLPEKHLLLDGFTYKETQLDLAMLVVLVIVQVVVAEKAE
jgi:hypothetical protein